MCLWGALLGIAGIPTSLNTEKEIMSTAVLGGEKKQQKLHTIALWGDYDWWENEIKFLPEPKKSISMGQEE